MWDFPLFPDQASSIAHQIDLIYFVLVGLATLFGVGVAAVLIYFAVKYRSTVDVDRSDAVEESLGLEMTWTLIPLGLAMGMFVWGAVVYLDIQAPPDDEPIEIYAVGKQWMWKFQHANGAREINTLHVPTGRTVKMIMTSQDVIHSFYVPAFRVKQDVLPGRFSSLWFKATNTGTYHLFCAEYCGTEHSFMEGDVVVMTPQAYEEWLRLGDDEMEEFQRGSGRYSDPGRVSEGVPVPGGAAASVAQGREMAAAGAALFGSLRCNACHRTDSSALRPSTGPGLEGVYGRHVTLRNERTIVADEQYLLESILYPYAKLVQGYPPIMPTYAGQVNETQLMQLVAYLKSLSSASRATEETTAAAAQADTAQVGLEAGDPSSGEALFTTMACNTCHATSPDPPAAMIGPNLYGIFGEDVTLENGETVAVDAAYVRASILHPQEQIVAGFDPLMPAYEGRMSSQEVADLIAYVRSLGR